MYKVPLHVTLVVLFAHDVVVSIRVLIDVTSLLVDICVPFDVDVVTAVELGLVPVTVVGDPEVLSLMVVDALVVQGTDVVLRFVVSVGVEVSH